MADITPIYSPLCVGRSFIGTITAYNPFKGIPISDKRTELLTVCSVLPTKNHYQITYAVYGTGNRFTALLPLGSQLLLLTDREIAHFLKQSNLKQYEPEYYI